jgi:hypothetical protein
MMTTETMAYQMYIVERTKEQNKRRPDMNTLQTTAKTLTIHTTLFDMMAAMQEEAMKTEGNEHNTDAQIVSTVSEWIQSGRIALYHTNPIQSAA